MKPSTILIALVAALTSALLVAGLATQSSFAVGFAFAAPVPIAVAGLGWGAAAGYLAAIGAPLILFVLSGNTSAGLATALAMTFPMAILAQLSLQRWSVDAAVAQQQPADAPATNEPGVQWMPISRILFVLAVLVAIACVLIGWLTAFDIDEISDAFIEAMLASNPDFNAAEQVQLENLMAFVVRLLPLYAPGLLALILVICLHFAGAVSRRSGRLERPRDDLPASVSLPQDALVLFAVALAGTFLEGPASLVAMVFAGALGTAFLLTGLARFHLRTRGRPARGLALFVVYLLIPFVSFLLLVFAVIGIVHVWRRGERLRPPKAG